MFIACIICVVYVNEYNTIQYQLSVVTCLHAFSFFNFHIFLKTKMTKSWNFLRVGVWDFDTDSD